MNENEILGMFNSSGALLEGHFQLTSGLHSPHYFQCAKVLQYPRNAAKLCEMIVRHFSEERIDAVVAPALGGIVVGQEVGRQLDVRTMFTERKDGVMQLRRGFEIGADERILVCEDVVTTGGSVREVIDIVKLCGAVPAGVACIVDRSSGTVNLPGFFTTLRMNVVTYQPPDCPLCRKGIPVEKPGSRSMLLSSKP